MNVNWKFFTASAVSYASTYYLVGNYTNLDARGAAVLANLATLLQMCAGDIHAVLSNQNNLFGLMFAMAAPVSYYTFASEYSHKTFLDLYLISAVCALLTSGVAAVYEQYQETQPEMLNRRD